MTSPLSGRTGISGLGLLSLGCRHCGCAKGQRFPGEAEDTRRPAHPPLVCADAALSPAPLPGHSQCRAWTGTFLIPGSGGAKTESQDGCGIGLNGPCFPRLMARPQPLEMQWGGGGVHTPNWEHHSDVECRPMSLKCTPTSACDLVWKWDLTASVKVRMG